MTILLRKTSLLSSVKYWLLNGWLGLVPHRQSIIGLVAEFMKN